MATLSRRNTPNPLLLPEIVGCVIDNVNRVPDLLNCACVNSIWSLAALMKLYKGSMNDMRFRTPDFGALNCLFVASRERFARNISFVKHLLLIPEILSVDDVSAPPMSSQRCRALRRRQDAELLLRPPGKRLTSLAIPFKIDDGDFSLLSDFLLPPTVEFLAIDSVYCGDLVTGSSRYPQKLTHPTEKLSNLKALTIYNSDEWQGVDHLCQLLQSCDLQFFQLDECSNFISSEMSLSDGAKLLTHLGRHQNLEVIALNIHNCDAFCASLFETPPWPRLKALYVKMGDRYWVEQIPKLKELEILCLQDLGPEIHPSIASAADAIARCRNLRVLDVVMPLPEEDVAQALLDIARGCPLLQVFNVRNGMDWDSDTPQLAQSPLLSLLSALSYLELLVLNWEVAVDATEFLQGISCHCPHLAVIDLNEAYLCLSLDLMNKIPPVPQLETMKMREIGFNDVGRLGCQDDFKEFATEWRRVFPRLRELLCRVDYFSGKVDDTGIGGWDSASEDEEDSMGWESDSFDILPHLFQLLGYGVSWLKHARIRTMWQSNLEAKITGWPVMPLSAFHDPCMEWRRPEEP